MREEERIRQLSDLFGPSGFEDEVAAYVRSELEPLKTVQDHMRNVRCELNPEASGPKVMLDAHLDEVGLIVQAIKPNGTMKFLMLGNMAASSLPSSRFLIQNSRGEKIPAVVAVKPPHFTSAAEKNAPLNVSDMVLDCGSRSAEETAETLGIRIGSPAVPDVVCRQEEKRGLFYGKAFDDRIGAAAQIEVLKRLAGRNLPCRVQGAFSVQEEVGERGVHANYEALKPEVLICFEGCPADDTFQEPYMVQAALGRGPMLRHYDVSMITNWRFQKLALDTAHEKVIPVQESVRSGGGTDGAAVNLEGVPAIVIGIPVRYIHSSNCWCAKADYEAAVDLAAAVIEKLDAETVSGL